jgi:nickel-dependent lactate racemase
MGVQQNRNGVQTNRAIAVLLAICGSLDVKEGHVSKNNKLEGFKGVFHVVDSRDELRLPADIALVSAGGYPKDLNLYQAQKALDNAACAVCDGGVLILVAECPEGLGNQTFETWMLEADSPDALLERIQREFVLGGHKAVAVAAVLKRASVFHVSALPDDLVRTCGMVPFDNVDAALDAAFERLGQDSSVLVMPQGGSILPVLGQPSR